MTAQAIAGITRPAAGRGRTFSFLLCAVAALGLTYEVILIFTPLLFPYRFPIPYAVPIFDTPFALVAIGVGYLCLERHRLRHDFRSVALGTSLWLAGLLAIAHILSQPDYPGTPGVNPGVAPYFFFLSYLTGFLGIGLATHYGDRQWPLSDRARLLIGISVLCLSAVAVISVLQIRALLPPLVMKPGRLTPFAIWAAGVSTGLVGTWALWGARKKVRGHEDWFARFLLFATFVWLLGLTGFLIFPFRYGVSWYLAGLARPLGVGVIFVGLLREQVWLYREARARQRDLEMLHATGQALVRSLDLKETLDTIATRALEVSQAAGAVVFRLEAPANALRAVSRAGRISPEFASALELPVGVGPAGLALAQRGPVWTSNLEVDDRIPLPPEARRSAQDAGLRAAVAIPFPLKTGQVFTVLTVYYREEREFADTDVELLSAFGTQASVAIENARAFDRLGLKARNDAALREFSHRLLEASEETAILHEAVRVTQDLLHADLTALFLLEPTSNSLRLEAGLGWAAGTVGVVSMSPSADSFAGYAFLQKESVKVEDLAQERRFTIPSYLRAHGVRAGAVVPVGVREPPVGVLGAYHRVSYRFSEEDSRILESLAQQTALALEKVRLHAALEANLKLQEAQAQLIQADKLKALGTLLSGMAHELNSPLSTILLSAQLLKRQPALPDAVRRRIDVVEQECERASQIIKDLLIFARQKPAERRRTDLNKILKAALALQAPQFELNSIRVVQQLEPALPDIWADPHQLQQVFLNLLSNATHAMKAARGRGTLTVRSRRLGLGVGAAVIDDGPGIPPEHIGRIFDPFFTTKGTGEGTGLGLSICLKIVEAHGGKLSVESLPGSGTRFTVELPVGEPVEPAETPSAEMATAPVGARILVVDDDAGFRALLTDILNGLGHRVESVATGREAIARLERQAYDLITLDFRLPDIHGKDIWRWLLERNAAQAPRLVFVTGDTMSAETQEFLQESGCPFLMKPVSVEGIQRIVTETLTPKPSAA